jgi:hypothetical protein
MNITLEDMLPALAELAKLRNGELEDNGDTLLLRLPTQKYKDQHGQALLEIVVRLDEGKLLLRCPLVFHLPSCPHWPQLFAACLAVQTVPHSAVQFMLTLPQWMGTGIELTLEDNTVTVMQLGMVLIDLHARTDSFYEPLMEAAQTGQFTRIYQSLPVVDILEKFAARS